MGGTTLFGDDLGGNEKSKRAKKTGGGEARVKRPDRRQVIMRPEVIDQLIPVGHRARSIVAAVEQLDLDAFYEQVKSRGNDPGRPATDPAMLIALWLFAISEGVGSGRQLERLCERDDAYRWICGGVQVNYHTLNDFRVQHGAKLDDLFTQMLAVLVHGGLVSLKRVAQDGVRVRASAGAGSFRRLRSLKKCLAAAKEQVKRTKALLDKDDPTRSDKARAAAKSAAEQQERRITRAMQELKRLRATKSTADADEARVSTTDPEARVMRMGDGGYRPAYNVQFATDTQSGVVVGVAVTNRGTDQGLITPMLADVERRTGKHPKEWLVDGGYTSLKDIQRVGEAGVDVLAPVPRPRLASVDPHEPKSDDPKHVASWRRRMATKRAKEIYKERAATAELVNADFRTHRGLDQFGVRGAAKVLTVALWMGLVKNVLAWISVMHPAA